MLLTNLGTPEAPTAKALKPYLKQFLWDPRVVEVPRPIWWLILNGIILNTRPKRSAEAYRAVWNERGSPLLAHLEDQVAGVAERLTTAHGDHFVVRGAMRYGTPAIGTVLNDMFESGIQKLVVLPLYPNMAGRRPAPPLMRSVTTQPAGAGYRLFALSARTTMTRAISRRWQRVSVRTGHNMDARKNWCCPTTVCPSVTSLKAILSLPMPQNLPTHRRGIGPGRR